MAGNFIVSNYTARVAKGTVQLGKVGNACFIVVSKFDPDSGDPLPDEVVGVDLNILRTQKATLAKDLAELDKIIADFEALPSK